MTTAAPAPKVRATVRPTGENRTMTWIWNVIGLGFAAVMAFPIYWMIITTFKTNKDLISKDPTFWPSSFSFQSFQTIFDDKDFLPSLQNTLLITLGSVVLGLVVGFLGAVAVARFSFRGRSFFIVTMLVVQMVPLLAIIVPLFVVMNGAGMTGTLFGVMLAYLVFTVPYVIWTLRSFIVNIPSELDEAAMVDGCTQWGAFFRVILPLTLPGLITTGVYCWIQAWNEFIVANTLLSTGGQRTAMGWLTFYATTPTRGADYGAQMAGALMVSLPVILMFVLFQKKVSAGLTAGAVKG
ncbi:MULTISPECIES: carbohydrate ABC transporter permease [Kitasatospora]|uniref:Multiple sugar transport system permease protein/N,N'-diacetylchitobiose transport system permease protein n=2 Tax=Kitasatospora TaxID=2063 RepID=A0ABT1IQY6_9ACTN|nr:carbohydrate ABC transporter permease [Kitasatospora paracochleata]MCP2307515.1 multiple sugar transport system permease protein/N,N'-diacetylchitobiose transport system permease protein [Kitasatospora paracochleata]